MKKLLIISLLLIGNVSNARPILRIRPFRPHRPIVRVIPVPAPSYCGWTWVEGHYDEYGNYYLGRWEWFCD